MIKKSPVQKDIFTALTWADDLYVVTETDILFVFVILHYPYLKIFTYFKSAFTTTFSIKIDGSNYQYIFVKYTV